MLGGRQQQAHFHSDFYRNKYRKMLIAIIVSCFIILLLISGVIYFILFQAPQDYYATTLGGQIIRMNPTS